MEQEQIKGLAVPPEMSMQAGSHQSPALLHAVLDRGKHGGCGDNAEITTPPRFDISPNVCGRM